jgi:signal transduction histidine kinase/HAMP domain-containing protein
MRLDSRTFTSIVARRTFALFVICSLVPVCALAALALHQVDTQLHDQAEQRLRHAGKTMAMALLNRLLAADAALGPTAEGARAPIAALRNPILGVMLSFDDGTDRPLFGETKLRPSFTEDQLVSLQRGKPVLTVNRDATGPARLVISHALDPNDPGQGILHGTIDPAFLWAVDEDLGISPDAQLVVLDEAGHLLFSSFGADHPLPDALTRQARERKAGQFEWRDGDSDYIAARWSLFLQASLTAPKWTVVLNESKAKVMAPMTTSRQIFLSVIAFTILTVLLVSVRQIRRSLTPVAQLKEGARRLAMGDLDARVEVASRDEFAEVATAFNTMASQLGGQFHTLAMRREVSAALTPEQGLDELLHACAQALVRHLDLAVVGIWLPAPVRGTLELRASAHRPGGPEEAPQLPMSGGELDRLLGTKMPYVNNALGPRDDLPDWAVRHGLTAFVAHPLVVDDRLLGVVAAFAGLPLAAPALSAVAIGTGDIARSLDRKQVGDALQQSEEQTRQLQKMEAVGRLAGGIAHDFNNLLTVITGRTHLLLHGMADDDPRRKGIKTIDSTAQRAALLTRQLLAFSRKQVLAPSVLELNEVVGGLMDMLHRLIGEQIELTFRPGGAGKYRLDRGQTEQVLVNLVVNARDAMPQGGRITLDTTDLELDEASARRHPGVGRGAYVMLSVTDTGTGMDEHTRARIFEPFFTTKEVGKGTGLGLATVYGIVQQSGGTIRVESELGAGTTFTLYFPRVEEAVTAPRTTDEAPRPGTETVLVVDDEGEVQALVQAVLVRYGYTVLGAERPTEALRIAERHPGAIHLLLTDVVMPEMGGPALAQRLRAVRPDMAVLFMSGYADYTVSSDPGSALLQKPFTPEAVARAVRTALDAVPAPRG